VVLGWKAPLNPGMSPVLHYNIYRRIEGDRERYFANASATVYMTGHLPAGTYYFRVVGVSESAVGYYSDEVAVTVKNQPPAADVTAEPTRGTSATRFNFTPNAQDQDGLIANYSWSFGDGGLSFKEDPYHVSGRRGIYNVTLRVTDDDGAVTASNITVEVLNTPPKITFPEPSAEVSLETGKKGGFEVVPVDPDEDTLHVTWYLDGQKVGEGSGFSASFEKAGFHQLKAVASDGQDSDEHAWALAVVLAPSHPSGPVNCYYYALGIVSAALAVAGGLVISRRAGRDRRKRPPPAGKGRKRHRGTTPGRGAGPRAKTRVASRRQSKRIL
jgi:PKD repeat protein